MSAIDFQGREKPVSLARFMEQRREPWRMGRSWHVEERLVPCRRGTKLSAQHINQELFSISWSGRLCDFTPRGILRSRGYNICSLGTFCLFEGQDIGWIFIQVEKYRLNFFQRSLKKSAVEIKSWITKQNVVPILMAMSPMSSASTWPCAGCCNNCIITQQLGQ